MIVRFLLIVILFLLQGIYARVASQQTNLDSLKKELAVAGNDTIAMILKGKLATGYAEINPDSTFRYASEMLKIAEQLDLPLERVNALGCLGYALINVGNFPRSLQILLSALAIAEDPQSEKNILPARFDVSDEFSDRSRSPSMQRLTRLSKIFQYLGALYGNAGYHEKSLFYYRTSLPISIQASNEANQNVIYILLGRAYLSIKRYDSALYCFQQAIRIAEHSGYSRYVGSAYLNSGRVYMGQGDLEKARAYFNKALVESEQQGYFRGVVASNLELANLFYKAGRYDSSLYCIEKGLPIATYLNAPNLLLQSYTGLANYYKVDGNSDSIVKYQSLIIKIKDSLFNSKQTQQFQNIDLDEQQRLQQIESAKTSYRNQLRTYVLIGGIIIFIFVALLLWRNGRQRKIANVILSKQKEELELTLGRLKSTQRQLVQSEKMASLGELTAGIAHEIQNPLNFVNNFSEVNRELITDLKLAAGKGDIEEVKQLALDLESNEDKIIVHGKRAESIVKGMLAHSRTGSGQKEPTDINALVDEFLRLSYHGFRAKDKNFNVSLKTNYDLWLGKIDIVAQDFGRALLNVFNNAFYAVMEKCKNAPRNFEPTVSVSTHKLNNGVEIRIGDNGPGIPENIREKIFQPFFTTKPAGQGTGLGLSLTYDIVKADGGEILLDTKEGEGTEFIIRFCQ
jgi:two-component system, NtrC family, sensor kinase